MKRGAIRIALSYLIISLLWIALSDKFLFLLKPKLGDWLYFIITFKGALFVVVTAIVLYLFIRRHSKALLINEIRYSEIYRANPNPMWIYDPETLGFASVNDAAIAMYGYSREEFLRMSILDIRPAEDHDMVVKTLKANKASISNKGTWRHITKSGKRLFVNITLNSISYKGKPHYMVLVRDMTESIEHEQKLREAITRYELVAKATKDIFYDFDLKQNKLEYHGNINEMVNLSADAIEDSLEWWRGLIHPDDLHEVQASQQDVIEQRKTVWECEYRIHVGDGNYKYVFDQAYLIFNDEQEPIRMIGAVKDIDAIKASEKENRRLAGIIMNVNNMVLVTDTSLRITWANNAFERFTGYAATDMNGRVQHELMCDPVVCQPLLPVLQHNLAQWEAFSMDLPLVTAAGKSYWVTAEFTPMFDEKGNRAGYISVQSDITLRKEKETEVATQMETLRNIAWMGSHQIRKPVATILGLVNLLEMTKHDAETEELVDLLKTTTLELDMVVHEINFEAFHVIDPVSFHQQGKKG